MEKSVQVFGDPCLFSSGLAGDDTLGLYGREKAFFFKLCVHLFISSCVPGYYLQRTVPCAPLETGFGGIQHLLTPTV